MATTDAAHTYGYCNIHPEKLLWERLLNTFIKKREIIIFDCVLNTRCVWLTHKVMVLYFFNTKEKKAVGKRFKLNFYILRFPGIKFVVGK